MKTFKKIWNVISVLIIVVLVFLAVALGGMRFLGFQVFAVLSGSMEPTYHVGSLIYVRSTEPADVEVGDPITFVANEDLVVVTHRVVDISVDEDGVIRFQTKGDANDTVDGSWVHQANLLGKPKFTIPYLGYLANAIQHPPGRYLMIAVVAILILLIFLPEIIKVFSSGDEKSAGEENAKKPLSGRRSGGSRQRHKSE